MYETYPKKVIGASIGKQAGWSNGHGTSYPDKSSCTSQNDAKDTNLVYERRNGQSAPGNDYPKKSVKFPGLEGLPS
jgi:hypothetical protein